MRILRMVINPGPSVQITFHSTLAQIIKCLVALGHSNFKHEFWNNFYPFISHISNSTDVGENTAIKNRIPCQKRDSSVKYNFFSYFTESAIFKVTFQNIFQRRAPFKSNVYHMHKLILSCDMLLPSSFLLENQWYSGGLSHPIWEWWLHTVWLFRLRYWWSKQTHCIFKDVSCSFLKFENLIWNESSLPETKGILYHEELGLVLGHFNWMVYLSCLPMERFSRKISMESRYGNCSQDRPFAQVYSQHCKRQCRCKWPWRAWSITRKHGSESAPGSRSWTGQSCTAQSSSPYLFFHTQCDNWKIWIPWSPR